MFMAFLPQPSLVMPGLVPGIHAFLPQQQSKTWMAGTSPAMTTGTTIAIYLPALSREAATIQGQTTQASST
jgi:hypothetical protein